MLINVVVIIYELPAPTRRVVQLQAKGPSEYDSGALNNSTGLWVEAEAVNPGKRLLQTCITSAL